MKLIRKKKRLWKSLKTNGSADLFLKFKDFRRKTKKLINSRYQQYLQSLSGKLQENPKHFWAFSILSNLRQNEFLKLLFMDTIGLGTWIRRWSYSMCFFIQFTWNLQLMLICWRQMLLIQTCYLKLPLYCTAPELEGILSKININKAIGVDNLPARILLTCAKELDLSSTCSFV